MAPSLRATEKIILDAWLSSIFSYPVYQVEGQTFAVNECSDLAEQIQTLKQQPVFLFAKISTGNAQGIHFFEKLGFHLIDTAVNFEKQISSTIKPSGRSALQFAESPDESGVCELARQNSRTSRFHLDPLISRTIADEIKTEWVRNFFKGKRGEKLILALDNNQIVGFLQVLRPQKNEIVIDLIATSQDHRRKGIASDMIAFTESHYAKECSKIRVGTQISNVPSIKLYQKLGFEICSSQYIFHFHNRPQ